MADNASITILRNTQANIDAEPIKDGNILFTTDQSINNAIYTDVGTKRIKIGGTVPIDSTITANSVNPVTSKAIYAEVDDVRGQICTNLLNPTAQTQTINGVTFTRNGDGTYTVNGTASAWTFLNINYINSSTLSVPIGTYKLTGTPPNNGGVRIGVIVSNKDFASESGSGVIFTVPQDTTNSWVRIAIDSGTTVNNLLFKPMLTTDLSATYDDYVPYTGDSGRLNEDVANLFDVIRPVGSLYSTTDANFNPNTAKGWHGTWERIKDCVIYAAGDSDTVGAIVGSNTHTLTIAELPKHTHSIPALSGTASSTGLSAVTGLSKTNFGYGFGTNSLDGYYPYYFGTDSSKHSHTVTTTASTTGASGSGTAIDIRPRRLNSIVWRRTA